MPSFKSVLASLALVALAFSPVSATASPAGVARRANQHAERAVSPSAAVARRAAAAKALKKRATRGSFTGSASSIMKGTTLAATAAKVRCGTNNVCRSRAPLGPANSSNVCYKGKCAYACNDGYAQSGTQCVATLAPSDPCGGVTCDVPANGYATCNNGQCAVGCNLGYTRYSANGDLSAPYVCFDTSTDVNHCGSGSNIVSCPASYNGIGARSCKNGYCSVTCPSGYTLRRANSASNPFYCYDGAATTGQA